MTLAEGLLWNELKNRAIMGYDFDRQPPIGNLIVDFYCKDLFLAIEIDGDSHIYRDEDDERRQSELEKRGIPTPNPSREGNRLNKIRYMKTPTPNPSREGNRLNKIRYMKTPTPNPSREGNLRNNERF
jgi:hypothetical protein